MARLTLTQKLSILRTMLLSRLGDQREQSLIRQGKGWFHVSGMGHEALAAAGALLRDGDFFSGYYRDRSIALARGMSNRAIAMAFFAKRASMSGGRQMPAHFSSRELGIFSIASVVGSSLLPACGLAWGLQLDRRQNLVLVTVGDAGARQGDCYEAIAFARERRLPVLFLVEDNGLGISTATTATNPLALEVFDSRLWQQVDGCCVDAVHAAVSAAMDAIRAGAGPRFLWCRTERLASHSSADDHRKYRPAAEIEALADKDPISRLRRDLIAAGALDDAAYAAIEAEIEAEVRRDYNEVQAEPDPLPEDLLEHVFGPDAEPPPLDLPAATDGRARMVDSINATFHAALRNSRDFIFFGQDIADPKGGVFSLTKGLSTAHPDNVFNAPLAESTIIGVAVGLAAYGKRPVFEIQFADYIWPGFNQLVTHLSTLHWRSNGEWNAPVVIYAPYGAYLPAGALWHSQTNEAAVAHFPGIRIAIPGTPEDAAGLFWSAMHDGSPSLLLIPKHLMWQQLPAPAAPAAVPFGCARRVQAGERLTVVTWGNGNEVVAQALQLLDAPAAVEVLDLRTVVPLDLAAVQDSVARTGRLLVVQEDGESCSVGQNIIARIVAGPLFARLLAPPTLVAKPDVNIGYNPVLEYAALPDPERVAAAMRRLLANAGGERPPIPDGAGEGSHHEPAKQPTETPVMDGIRVPMLGEGITSARLVSILAQPGQRIRADDPLCEVETDKALFPIEAPCDAVLGDWLVAEGDDVEVGQRIALLADSAATPAANSATATTAAPPHQGGLGQAVVAKIRNVVAAHMTVKAGWHAIRAARAAARATNPAAAPSPTVMIAWAVVRAMQRHPVFTCTIQPDETLRHNPAFDFGVAVALPDDALDTAVIARAASLDWPAFVAAYTQAVEAVRTGRVASKSAVPLILTSMGGFNVRDALPVVVPPAIATLFVGEAHREFDGDGAPHERASLCLSFDHRWLNGVAGAQFLAEVRQQMENFTIAG